jgi:hypothetical protein
MRIYEEGVGFYRVFGHAGVKLIDVACDRVSMIIGFLTAFWYHTLANCPAAISAARISPGCVSELVALLCVDGGFVSAGRLRIFTHQRRPHLSKNFDCFFAHWQLPGFGAQSNESHRRRLICAFDRLAARGLHWYSSWVAGVLNAHDLPSLRPCD